MKQYLPIIFNFDVASVVHVHGIYSYDAFRNDFINMIKLIYTN